MRIAAVALVLVVGAAVVLWFGNTLNSWVLGGLIGGLAALLLSIPISLTLFSFLSHRHNEQLEAEEQERVSLSRSYPYSREYDQVYGDEAYVLEMEMDAREYEEQERLRALEIRNLPVPTSQPRLPAPAQSRSVINPNAMYQQRGAKSPATPRQRPQARATDKGRGMPQQRPVEQQRVNGTGFLNYQANSIRQHQTEALRIARQEALRRSAGEVFSTHSGPSKRLPAVRSNQSLVRQPDRPQTQRPTRQAQQPETESRSRRVVESLPSRQNDMRRHLPASGESTASRPAQTDALREQERDTDRLREQHYPETGPMRKAHQTGQTVRNPRISEQLRNPDTITGTLKNPLVRRPPYTYDDDPIRQELAQQIERPIRRRSSRDEDPEE